MEKSKQSRLSDFDRFQQMAPLFQQGMRFRQIAEELKISNSTISAVLDSIEHRFGGTALVIRDDVQFGQSRMTEAGEEVLRRLGHLLDFDPRSEPQSLSLAIPHSILNSTSVTRGVDRFLKNYEQASGAGKLRVHLEVRNISEVQRMRSEIEAGQLDMALAWIVDSQKQTQLGAIIKDSGKGRSVEVIESDPFDVVLVSHSTSMLMAIPKEVFDESLAVEEKEKKLRDFFKRHRTVIMHPENQPLLGAFGGDVTADSNADRVQVGNIDAAIATLSARCADYGVLPLMPSHLRQHQHTGSLAWSDSIGSVTVALLMRDRSSIGTAGVALANDLMRMVNAEANFGIEFSASLCDFPMDYRAYERLAFGYYIDVDRPDSESDEAASSVFQGRSTHWRWEELRVRARMKPMSDKPVQVSLGVGDASIQNVFDVEIRNQAQDRFSAVMLASDSALNGRVVAMANKSRKGHGPQVSVVTFVSVMTRCVRIDADHVAFAGVWIGLNKNELPAAYASIWSQKALSEQVLQQISETVLTRSVLLADCDRDFSITHPTSSRL